MHLTSAVLHAGASPEDEIDSLAASCARACGHGTPAYVEKFSSGVEMLIETADPAMAGVLTVARLHGYRAASERTSIDGNGAGKERRSQDEPPGRHPDNPEQAQGIGSAQVYHWRSLGAWMRRGQRD